MRITLVVPPSPFLIDDRVFPYLGPLQIAAVGYEAGHLMDVLDLTGFKRRNPGIEPTQSAVLDESLKMIREFACYSDMVGFYSLATQHPIVVRLHEEVRRVNPRCTTVLGGPHANTAPMKCIEDGFDYVVVSDQGGGGGELGFLEVAANKSTSRVVAVPSRVGAKWENDRWPLPARGFIDLRSYVYHIEGERATSVVTMAGCPFGCSYCSHWCGYRKIEGKSSGRVKEEIESIKRDYGFRAIMFYDDELNLRPDFVDEFLPMMHATGTIWRAFFKSGRNLTRDEVFEQMAASGCVQLCTGAESADPIVLKKIGKGTTVEDNTNFVRLCVKHGIKPKVFTQVGLPGETKDSIKNLRDWLVQMAQEGLTDADVTITTPFEGAPLYDDPEKYGISFDKETLNFSKESVLYKTVPGQYRSFVHHPGLAPDDIVSARQWIEDEFRKAAGLTPLAPKDEG